MPHAVVLAQIEQISTGSAGQLGQSGPLGVRRSTRRPRPQLMQVSRFVGSLMKQSAQIGRPF
jgi:hypothetical protein